MEVPLLNSWWPIVTLLLGGIIYLFFTRNHDFWRKRGVPYIKPLPLFGNFKDTLFGRKYIGDFLQDIYWKLDGHKFGGLFRFAEPMLMIRDPELIKNVLVRDFTSFHDNNIQVDTNSDPMFGRNPFVLRGERWKITRSQLVPVFTVAKLKTLFPLVEEVCQELKEHIEENTHSGEFEAKELCACFTTNVVASCAFGIYGNAIKDPKSEFRQMGREIIEPSFFNNIKLFALFLLPWVATIFNVRFVPTIVENFFRRIVGETVTYREQNNVTRNDYLQHLINLKHKATGNITAKEQEFAPEKNIFTDEDVAAQALTFFIDGFETSSAALSFSLYCLATNPDVQIRAREEVNSVLKKHGGALTFEGIQEMTYVDMVLSEALRMYTPIAVITRECTKPFKLETTSGGIYEVEVGTPIVIPVSAVHYDPQYYPDPKTYDPERFSEENKKNRNKYLFLAFGDGPRVCLGARFAQMQVKAGIASIISNFELRKTKRTPIPFKPNPNTVLLGAKDGLWIQFIKIK